jgi:hypothetical protein
MSRYELDDYVQEHPAEYAVNVNCVASWCACAAADRVESLRVSLHNGWHFDSRRWNGRAHVPGLILSALRRNERGRSDISAG